MWQSFWGKVVLAAVGLMTLSAVANSDIFGIDSGSKRLASEVDQLRKSLETLTYDAVPGAWWNRLVRQMNSDDPKEREAAQRFLENVARIDPKKKFEARVRFGFTGDETIEFDYFFASTPSEAEVDAYLNSQSYNDKRTGVNIEMYGSDAIRRNVKDLTLKALKRIRPWWENCRQLSNDRFKACTIANEKNQDAAAEDLTNAIFESSKTFVLSNKIDYADKEWSPLDQRPFLFVLITKSSLDRFKSGDGKICREPNMPKPDVLCILVAITEASTPKDLIGPTYQNISPVFISLEEFRSKPEKPNKKNSNDPLLFAVQNLSDDTMINAAMVKRLEEFRKALDDWQQ